MRFGLLMVRVLLPSLGRRCPEPVSELCGIEQTTWCHPYGTHLIAFINFSSIEFRDINTLGTRHVIHHQLASTLDHDEEALAFLCGTTFALRVKKNVIKVWVLNSATSPDEPSFTTTCCTLNLEVRYLTANESLVAYILNDSHKGCSLILGRRRTLQLLNGLYVERKGIVAMLFSLVPYP